MSGFVGVIKAARYPQAVMLTWLNSSSALYAGPLTAVRVRLDLIQGGHVLVTHLDATNIDEPRERVTHVRFGILGPQTAWTGVA